MIDWFRSWHGAPTDPKWLLIGKRAGVAPGVVSAIVWALFDFASQEEERGSIAGFDVETYTVFSGFDEDKVRAVLAELDAKGITVAGRIAQWDRRQPKREEASSARVSKHRKKLDAEPTLPLEHASDPVPPPALISAQESEPAPIDIAVDDVSAATPSPQAIQLADDIAVAAGHDLEFVPPSWCGAATRVEMWLDRGWSPPLILQSVKAQMTRKRDGPPASIRYFEKGILSAHAENNIPLPSLSIVDRQSEVIHVVPAAKQKNSGIAAVERLRERIAAAAGSGQGDP